MNRKKEDRRSYVEIEVDNFLAYEVGLGHFLRKPLFGPPMRSQAVFKKCPRDL